MSMKTLYKGAVRPHIPTKLHIYSQPLRSWLFAGSRDECRTAPDGRLLEQAQGLEPLARL